MGTLSSHERNKLPDSDFALPGRRYPIPDIAHARNALARVAQNGTPAEQAAVRRAVYAKYPALKNETQKSVTWNGAFSTQINKTDKGYSVNRTDPDNDNDDDSHADMVDDEPDDSPFPFVDVNAPKR